jgi:hypothetical protein
MCDGKFTAASDFDRYLVGLLAAESEMIAANLELEGITEWRGADKDNIGSRQETHFAEPEKGGAGLGEILYSGRGAERELGKLQHCGHGGGSTDRADTLDNDVHRSRVAEGQPGAVDLAQAGRTAGNLRHQSGLAEAHLPETLAEIFVAPDLTNPSGRASGKLAKREQGRAGGMHVIET